MYGNNAGYHIRPMNTGDADTSVNVFDKRYDAQILLDLVILNIHYPLFHSSSVLWT